MSDRWPVLAVVAAWCGALVASSPPVPVVVAVVVLAVVGRHPAPACVVVFVVTACLADRALDGLDPVAAGPFRGPVTLLTDPAPSIGGLRVELDTGRGRLLGEVRSPAAVLALAGRLAGDRAAVTGRTQPFGRTTEWTMSRHLAGRITVESVEAVGPGSPPTVLANRFRSLLDRGARSLPVDRRALLAGLVLGDDRAQPPELTADFRAAGLTHLLAVSGQNLAMILVVAGPLLRRLRLWPRFVVSVAAIGGFALVTRFEPSVLRAAAMAIVALYAVTTGRASGGVRHLALGVVALLAIDPLLVHSLGFRLSVAASVGVLVLAPRFVSRLPGPRWFREGLGVTAGAQLAVAPVLVPVLGPMPLAALPANVVAGPLAGLLMAWGLTAGTVAGVAGGAVARVAHLPTAFGLACLEAVASLGASLPLGRVDLRHVVVLAVALVAFRTGRTWGRAGGLVLVVAVVAAPVLTPVPLGARDAGFDATVFVDGPVGVVVVGDRAEPVDVLDALREADVVAVGVLVARSDRSSAVVDAVRARFPVGAVVGPPGPDPVGVVVPASGLRMRIGRISVVVDRSGPPLRVRVGWVTGGADAARSPGRATGHRR